MSILDRALVLASAVPQTNPTAPPGSEKIERVINYVAWGMTAACVMGMLIVAITMAIQHRVHGPSEHMSKLGWVIGACIIGSGASAFVGAMV